jgi:hypothetical protein
MSITTTEKKIKQQIIKLLKARKMYTKEIDDFLIDQLLFNLKLIDYSIKDIQSRGTMVNIGKDQAYWQINFSISIFHNPQ